MITFLRSIFNSKLGVALSLAFVLLVGLAFAMGDITGSKNFGGGKSLLSGGSDIAKVGGRSIDSNEVTQRVQNSIDIERRQQPGLDMATFLAGGGFEGTLDQIINVAALERFGHEQGIRISKRLVDGEIASMPAFFGPTGTFDRNAFLRLIGERRISEAQIRDDIKVELLTRQLLLPAANDARMPAGVARPYAALSLESRNGLIGFVPAAAMPRGAAPNDAELAAYYKRNLARYTVPERRIIRYAPFGLSSTAGKSAPTEAEIADYYRKNGANYAASETRDLSQVILQDQAAVRAFEAKLKAGTSFTDAAKQAGLDPVALKAQNRAAFAKLSSDAAAAAVFAQPRDGIAPAQRSGLGWHIVRVDAINATAARPLAAVRAEIVAALTAEKEGAQLADLAAKIQDGIDDGQTFDEIVKANGLKAVTTPAITSTGQDPDNPAVQANPEFARFLEPMFESQPDDDAAIETVVPDKEFALADLDRIIPAAPRPLAQIKAQVTADFERERAVKQARTVADTAIAKVGKGMPFAQALREGGVALPAPKPVGGRRRELTQGGQRVPPPLALMFSMKEKSAKRLEAPGGEGWYIVWLDKIIPGDVRSEPMLIPQLQAEFSRLVGQEYASQFTDAVKAELGVKRNPDAEAKLKRQLAGNAGQ
jgi:peptidyl-prolyl cis-trans isomerase D